MLLSVATCCIVLRGVQHAAARLHGTQVPKFSKFIHGCATLLPDDVRTDRPLSSSALRHAHAQVRAFPFWLDTVHAEYEGWEGSKPKAGGNRPSSADKQKVRTQSTPSAAILPMSALMYRYLG